MQVLASHEAATKHAAKPTGLVQHISPTAGPGYPDVCQATAVYQPRTLNAVCASKAEHGNMSRKLGSWWKLGSRESSSPPNLASSTLDLLSQPSAATTFPFIDHCAMRYTEWQLGLLRICQQLRRMYRLPTVCRNTAPQATHYLPRQGITEELFRFAALMNNVGLLDSWKLRAMREMQHPSSCAVHRCSRSSLNHLLQTRGENRKQTIRTYIYSSSFDQDYSLRCCCKESYTTFGFV